MTHSCCICKKSYKYNSIHLFRFPFKNPVRLRKWVDIVRTPGFWPTKSSRICSDHFLESDYDSIEMGKAPRLKDFAVPSRNLKMVRLEPRPILAKPESQTITSQQQLVINSLNNESRIIYLTDISSLNKLTDLSGSMFLRPVPPLVPTSSNRRKGTSAQMAVRLNQTHSNVLNASPVVNEIKVPNMTNTRTQTIGVQARIETDKEIALKKEVKVLMQKIRRKEKKISCLKEVLYALKKSGVLERDASELIDHYFDDSE